MITTIRLTTATTTLFLLVLVTVQCASAAVSERDLLNVDDRLLTYDDVNHREWLDLSYTYGTDLELIQESMQPGEFLAGFQFATVEDVHGLNVSAGLDPISQLQGIEQLIIGQQSIDQLVDYLGFISLTTGGPQPGRPQYIVEFTPGQVAVDFEAGRPVFNDTNVVLLNNSVIQYTTVEDETSWINNQSGWNQDCMCFTFDLDDTILFRTTELVPPEQYIENRMTVAHPDDFVGVTTSSLDTFFAPSLAVGDKGSFWLYREVVPEPTTIGLLLSGLVLLFASRRQYA